MVKAEVYRDGKHEGSIEGKLLIATVAGQFGISEHRVLNMLALQRLIDDEEQADE